MRESKQYPAAAEAVGMGCSETQSRDVVCLGLVRAEKYRLTAILWLHDPSLPVIITGAFPWSVPFHLLVASGS